MEEAARQPTQRPGLDYDSSTVSEDSQVSEFSVITSNGL
jgi:hypothetical protein